ncbi:MAG: sensor histidine kinase [Microbacteriaceae bacterium]|nr:sensor histidine kinase [Microbacteriaceae bacterium]MCL2796238.1 sensor histidine kinase [Microbacteriaceae bacterium]
MPDPRRSRVRLGALLALSLIVQFATTAWALQLRGPSFRDNPRVGLFWYSGATHFLSGRPHAVPVWVAVLAFACALAGPLLLPLVWRRPGPALAAVTAAAVLGTLVCAAQGLAAPFYVSVLFGVAAASFQRARAWAWSCAGAYWLGFALASFISVAGLVQIGWLVPLTLMSVGALLGPEFGRSRRDARAQLLRDAEARRAEEAQAERVRIARELHDVLAHSLSQINVQASVGLHLFDAQPEGARDALASIKDSSKQALGEVRQVLGMLRGDAPLVPEQGLAGLAALVDGLGAQGIEGTLTMRGGADVVRTPAAVQQAVYRIVQEALTNVTKHAGARHVSVEVDGGVPHGTFRYGVDTIGPLVVRISDDGVGAASAPSPDGRGLLGMRERAELLGGSFSAGPQPGGGFRVEASLPLPAGASRPTDAPGTTHTPGSPSGGTT